jgi:hypothetical protein
MSSSAACLPHLRWPFPTHSLRLPACLPASPQVAHFKAMFERNKTNAALAVSISANLKAAQVSVALMHGLHT